jgi:hypothetical protein
MAKKHVDACKGCDLRGHMTQCLECECSIHDSWFATRLQEVISTVVKVLDSNNFIQ